MKTSDYIRSKHFWILALLCFLSLFLFLGQTYFNTRGEPREALVGLAMLEEGNWTLPITNGVDIAYKPPLFHWAIASISSIIGTVNEYTSRMPSAIALAAMILSGFLFYAKRRGSEIAFLTSLITLTNFEVHRAGTNCRVDMLLSALMVIALYALYHWAENKLKGIPWIGILCLSGAFLTKGPVGLVLPCLVVAVFALLRGINFFRIFFSFAGVALGACVIPALWYYAAWKQGGDTFMDLVIEENVLRFLGKMSYTSHENPWHYNVLTVVAGFVPYTLLLLFSVFTFKFTMKWKQPKVWWNQFKKSIQEMDDTRLFTLLSIVIMFVFYCIPKSKRSVYLLPIYPFIAYFIAEYIIYLVNNKQKVVTIYNGILASLGILLTVVLIIIKCGLIPHSIFQGKHADENIGFLQALEDLSLGINWLLIMLPIILGIYYFTSKKSKSILTYGGGILALTLFMSLDGVYLPAILNTKSNLPVAERIKITAPNEKVYSFITDTEPGNRMHPFTVNFYMGGNVLPFIEFEPTQGILLLDESETAVFNERYGHDYSLEQWPNSRYKSCDNRRMTHIYSFQKK